MNPPGQLGPYRIVQPLGEGGMGAVFEAVQEPIGRRVAVKVLLPHHARDRDAVGRFFNEARAVNLIEHPSIVQISDYGQADDGTAYLVMELLRGETLGQRLDALQAAGRRLPALQAARIGMQLADALAAAHEKGVIHRDLKPSNVMLVRDAAVAGGVRAKVLDFGIAKLAQGPGRAHAQGPGTATHAVMGTPQYMSPEQCAGAGGVDDRTDVYALGVMLFELLAGQLPFRAATPLEYMGQHAFAAPPPLLPLAPLAPPELVALVQRLLVKDRKARPGMRAVGAELARIVAGGRADVQTGADLADLTDQPTRRFVPQPRPPSTLGGSLGQTLPPAGWRGRRLVVAGVGGAAVAGLSALLLGLRGGPVEQPEVAQTAAPVSAAAPAKTDPAPVAARATASALPRPVAEPLGSPAAAPASSPAPRPSIPAPAAPVRAPARPVRGQPAPGRPAAPARADRPAARPTKPPGVTPPTRRVIRYVVD